MGKLEETMNFLKEDTKKMIEGWQTQCKAMSLLQREDVTIDDLLEMSDPTEDENSWKDEYNGSGRINKLVLYRRRMEFLQSSRKEWIEEYDPDISDCDYMRLIDLPYTDSRFAIDYGLHEMRLG